MMTTNSNNNAEKTHTNNSNNKKHNNKHVNKLPLIIGICIFFIKLKCDIPVVFATSSTPGFIFSNDASTVLIGIVRNLTRYAKIKINSVPLINKPLLVLKFVIKKLSNLLSNHANGIKTPIAITVPGTA